MNFKLHKNYSNKISKAFKTLEEYRLLQMFWG